MTADPPPTMPNRSVFFVSDGTGITAETFGNSILAQFPALPRHVRRPFIETPDKAREVLAEINQVADSEGKRPIVFITLVDEAVRQIITGPDCRGMVLDILQAGRTVVDPYAGGRVVLPDQYAGAWLDRRGGVVQPLAYARELARTAIGAGVAVHGNTLAKKLERSGDKWVVTTASGATVTADRVVLATNGYTGDLWPRLSEIKCPALMLWGRHDIFFDLEETLSWMKALPRMEAHILDGPHFLLETHPAECAALMSPFVSRAEGLR